ncbi:serine/threonine protein kinase [Frankia sp. CcWB2]
MPITVEWSERTPSAVVPRGYRVGPFTVTDKIAAGSWGTVYGGYRADRDGLSGRRPGESRPRQAGAEVALKFLPVAGLSPRERAELRAGALREAALVRIPAHPRLIRALAVLAVDDPDRPDLHGAVVLAVERATGNLVDLLYTTAPLCSTAPLCPTTPDASSGPPLADRVRILVEVCEGLAHMHANSWVHGDLKPSNVLIMPDGSARLADFGLAVEIDGTHGRAPRLASPDHTPPEWWSERITEAGVPIRMTRDVWAFGVLAHQLLTGTHPFPGQTSRSRSEAALTYAAGRTPLRLAETLPDGWREVIRDCLAPTHQARAAHPIDTVLRRARALQRDGDAITTPTRDLRVPRPGPDSPVAPPTQHTNAVQRTAVQRTAVQRTAVQRTAAQRTAAARRILIAVGLLAVLMLAAGSVPQPFSFQPGGELRPGAPIPAAYRPLLTRAAHACSDEVVTPALIAAILATQSGFHPRASHPAAAGGQGEYGIAGWTPRVFTGFAVDADNNGRASYWDPADAIFAVANQLEYANQRLGDISGDRALLLAAAYHTSVKYVRANGARGPQVRGYVERVQHYLSLFTDRRPAASS